MGQVAEVLLKVKYDGAQGQRGLDQLLGQINKLQGASTQLVDPASLTQGTNALGGLVKGLTLAAGAAGAAHAAFGLFVDSSKKAIAAVESINLFTVSMGSAASATRQWAAEQSQALRLNEVEVLRQVGTWNNILLSLKLSREQAEKMSKQLTILAQDMASFYDLDPTDAFDRLRGAMTGEFERMKRLGVLVNEEVASRLAWERGIARTGVALTQQQKTLAVYQTIMEGTIRAQGDLARTMESPANALRGMGALWTQVKERMGAFWVESSAATAASGVIIEALQGISRALGNLIEMRNRAAGKDDPLAFFGPDANLEVIAKDAEAAASRAKARLTELKAAWDALPERLRNADVEGARDVATADSLNSFVLGSWHGLRRDEAETVAGLADQIKEAEKAVQTFERTSQAARDRLREIADENERDRRNALEAPDPRIAQTELAILDQQISRQLEAGEAIDKLVASYRRWNAELVAATKAKDGERAAYLVQEQGLSRIADYQKKASENGERLNRALESIAAYNFDRHAEQWRRVQDVIKEITDDLVKMEHIWLEGAVSSGFLSTQVNPNVNAGMVDQARAMFQTQAMDDLWRQYSLSVGETFGRGITDALASGDFEQAWQSVWQSLSSNAAETLTRALFGYTEQYTDENGRVQTRQVAGIFGTLGGGKQLSQGALAGAAVGQLVGGYLQYQGTQSENRGQAALGGFIAGGSAGLSAGLGWWSIIPAVVMAVAAYMGAGKNKTDYNFKGVLGTSLSGTLGAPWSPWSVDVTGYGDKEEADMARRIQDKYRSLSHTFREVLRALELPVGDFKQVVIDWHGAAGDFNAVLQHLLETQIPEELFKQYRGVIEGGLEQLGVGASRIGELMARFSEGDPEQALQFLIQYIQAIVDSKKLFEKLGKASTSEGLMQVATQSDWDTYLQGSKAAWEAMAKLSEGFRDLDMEEQLKVFADASRYVEAQYEAAVQMARQLAQLREGMITGTLDWYANNDMRKARTGGLGAWSAFASKGYTDTLGNIQANYTSMTPDELQKSYNDLRKWADQLTAVADAIDQLIPQFDALLAQFTSLNKDLRIPYEERWARLGESSTDRFKRVAGGDLSEILKIKGTLSSLAGPDLLAAAQKMHDLTRDAFEAANENLQAIYDASQSIAGTYKELWASWDEAEARKQGPDALGNYYVEQLKALQQQMFQATSPEELRSINEQIAKYSQALYGLDDEVMLQVNGQQMNILEWLRPFTQGTSEYSQGKLQEWGKQNQEMVDKLKEAIFGVWSVLHDEKDRLQLAAESYRKLIEETLGPATELLVDQVDALTEVLVDNVATFQAWLMMLQGWFTGTTPGETPPTVPVTPTIPGGGPGNYRLPGVPFHRDWRGWGWPWNGDEGGGTGALSGAALDLVSVVNGTASATPVDVVALALDALRELVESIDGAVIYVEAGPGLSLATDRQVFRVIERGGI